jgi:hypothetical protein
MLRRTNGMNHYHDLLSLIFIAHALLGQVSLPVPVKAGEASNISTCTTKSIPARDIEGEMTAGNHEKLVDRATRRSTHS